MAKEECQAYLLHKIQNKEYFSLLNVFLQVLNPGWGTDIMSVAGDTKN